MATGSPLFALFRAVPGPDEVVRTVLETLDAERLLRESLRHGLVGYVDEVVRASGAELADPVARELSAQARGTAAAVLRTKRALLTALDALAPVGIRPLVLKGFPLASRLYPSPLVRTSRDVDLLVRREHLAPAIAALERAGFRRIAAPVRHHVELRLGTELLELHFDALEGFGERLAAEPLFDRATNLDVEGRPALGLSSADEALYLALHAVNHLLQRTSWLLDLKRLWQVQPPDAELLARRAGETPLGRYAYFALETSHRLLGAPIPPELLDRLRPSRVAPALSRALFTEGAVASAWYWDHRWAWHGAKLALLGNPGALSRWVRARRRSAAR